MSTLPLTALQEQLWRFIGSSRLSPSFEEMRTHLGVRSKSDVARLVDSLEDRGFVKRRRYIARSIVAIDPSVPDIINVKTSDLLAELERRGILLGCAR